MSSIVEMFTEIIGVIIAVYVAFVVISQLTQITPEFSFYGWSMFITMILGIVAVILKRYVL